MKNLFMVVNGEVKEVNVINEDNENYYLDLEYPKEIRKKFNCIYCDYHDNRMFFSDSKEGAIKRYNKDILNDIESFEHRINILKKRLI